ncbi:MAG: S41 family peptidase [Paraprevotella sp.]|nr:S41 family peptidase [Paraprevotella sp.]
MKRLILIVLSALLMAGCVDEEQFDNTPEGNLEALWKLIDEHYCFLDYKAEAIGLDWGEVHGRYRKMVHQGMTSAQLHEVLCNMLSELKDGHVNLYSAADVGRYWSWKDDYPDNLDVELRDAYLGDDYRIASGLCYRILDDNVGYIVYTSFSSGIGEGNIAEVLHYLRLCSGLIIDVRGNGGGQLDYEQRLASHFTNERIHVGYRSHKTGPGHGEFSSLRAEYLEPSRTIRWQKPVIVLTNRGCYSATNTFVRDMLCCPNVRTLGDSTGGGGGMPFTGELPCGWLVRFSACPQFDRERRHIEFGIPPTIPCALKDEDVVRGCDTLIETARELLREQ